MPPRPDTAGVFRDGWTSEDIQWVSELLSPELGWRLIGVWEYVDAIATGGHSNLGLIAPDGTGAVIAVSRALWDHLVHGDPFPGKAPFDGAVLVDRQSVFGRGAWVDRWNYAMDDRRFYIDRD